MRKEDLDFLMRMEESRTLGQTLGKLLEAEGFEASRLKPPQVFINMYDQRLAAEIQLQLSLHSVIQTSFIVEVGKAADYIHGAELDAGQISEMRKYVTEIASRGSKVELTFKGVGKSSDQMLRASLEKGAEEDRYAWTVLESRMNRENLTMAIYIVQYWGMYFQSDDGSRLVYVAA